MADVRIRLTTDDIPLDADNPRPAQPREVCDQIVTPPAQTSVLFLDKVTRTVHFVPIQDTPRGWLFIRIVKGTHPNAS